MSVWETIVEGWTQKNSGSQETTTRSEKHTFRSAVSLLKHLTCRCLVRLHPKTVHFHSSFRSVLLFYAILSSRMNSYVSLTNVQFNFFCSCYHFSQNSSSLAFIENVTLIDAVCNISSLQLSPAGKDLGMSLHQHLKITG